MNGKFVVLEGGEGCGKGTQLKLLEAYLKEKGYGVQTTREPGGTVGGEIIRNDLLLHPDVDLLPNTELLLFYASRMELNNRVIVPALERGDVILTDRYDLSTFAYQVYTQGASQEMFKLLSNSVRRPDLAVILEVESIDAALERAKNESGKRDWFESKPLSFHRSVWKAYGEVDKSVSGRVERVPWGSIGEVHEKIVEKVKSILD
tara:strand:+ start:692 stop:1306 length:615 start_codon:yes stop_codon:yes gene_type:complete